LTQQQLENANYAAEAFQFRHQISYQALILFVFLFSYTIGFYLTIDIVSCFLHRNQLVHISVVFLSTSGNQSIWFWCMRLLTLTILLGFWSSFL